MNFILHNSVCKDIGQLKLEHIINRAVFLAPKAYYLDLLAKPTSSSIPIIKIKGLNKEAINKVLETELTFNKFYTLLFKDSTFSIQQSKWFKNLSEGSIKILDQGYEIKHNSNKRQLIYNTDNRLIATKPYILPLNK